MESVLVDGLLKCSIGSILRELRATDPIMGAGPAQDSCVTPLAGTAPTALTPPEVELRPLPGMLPHPANPCGGTCSESGRPTHPDGSAVQLGAERLGGRTPARPPERVVPAPHSVHAPGA